MGKDVYYSILIGCVLFFATSHANALGVSDATPHVYLSEQVKQLPKQLEKMQAQVNEAVKAYETLTKSYEAVSGKYCEAKWGYDDVMKTKAFLNDSYYTERMGTQKVEEHTKSIGTPAILKGTSAI